MEQAIIKKRVIGVDISLEETTYAIVNAKGEILVKDSFPNARPSGYGGGSG